MSDDLCLRFVFDTYEQEVERYGGPEGMAAAEALFFVDSRYVAELLRCSGAKQWPHDRTTLLVISLDDLLDGLGMSVEERLGWYRKQATPGGPEAGSDYRERKAVLRSLLGTPSFLANEPGGAEVAEVFKSRRAALSPVADSLRRLRERVELERSFDELCASFAHQHVNRLGGLASLPEPRILSLLRRTREGLHKSPAAN